MSKTTYKELLKTKAKLESTYKDFVEKVKALRLNKNRTLKDHAHLQLLEDQLMPAIQNELAEIDAELETIHTLQEDRFYE